MTETERLTKLIIQQMDLDSQKNPDDYLSLNDSIIELKGILNTVKSFSINEQKKLMTETETLIYWEKWLKGKDALIRQYCEEIGNANTSEERDFYHRVYDLIQNKY